MGPSNAPFCHVLRVNFVSQNWKIRVIPYGEASLSPTEREHDRKRHPIKRNVRMPDYND